MDPYCTKTHKPNFKNKLGNLGTSLKLPNNILGFSDTFAPIKTQHLNATVLMI